MATSAVVALMSLAPTSLVNSSIIDNANIDANRTPNSQEQVVEIEPKTYEVKSGDTLNAIVKKQFNEADLPDNITQEDFKKMFIELNQEAGKLGSNINKINVGATFTVPSESSFAAKQESKTTSEVVSSNEIKETNEIKGTEKQAAADNDVTIFPNVPLIGTRGRVTRDLPLGGEYTLKEGESIGTIYTDLIESRVLGNFLRNNELGRNLNAYINSTDFRNGSPSIKYTNK